MSPVFRFNSPVVPVPELQSGQKAGAQQVQVATDVVSAACEGTQHNPAAIALDTSSAIMN